MKTKREAHLPDVEDKTSESAPEAGAQGAAGTVEAPRRRRLTFTRPAGPRRVHLHRPHFSPLRFRGRASGRRPARAVVVLSVTTAVFAASTAVLAHAWYGQQARTSEAAAVKSAASRFLSALTNFTPRNVDHQFAAVQSSATGSFAGQADRFFNTTIRQQLETAHAQSRGQIRDLYVQSIGGGTATLYAVVDQTYVNDKVASPVGDVLRLVVDMKKIGSTWKVSTLTVLQAPTASSGP